VLAVRYGQGSVMSERHQEYIEKINELRREARAVILAHNYQRPEIQDIADYTGDSLGLARKAMETEAETIVFCGVHFMAETAHILNPEKTVLIPDPSAGCPMADMVTAEGLSALKSEHPGVPVVCYVNSSAAVKAVSDVCCTSANGVSIVENLPGDEAIFVPDENLGRYVAERTGKKVVLWPGYCPTHRRIKPETVSRLKRDAPGAVFMAHPECDEAVLVLADHICSTSGMYSFARETEATDIIVGSEIGMLHRLRLENPGKTFIMPGDDIICPNMKLTTLKKVYLSLLERRTVVTLPEDIRLRALAATERMVKVLA